MIIPYIEFATTFTDRDISHLALRESQQGLRDHSSFCV